MECLKTYSLCDGDKKCRAICQLKDALDLALAIGGISYQAGSVIVMEGTSQDLTGAGRVAIQQHHQWHLVDRCTLIQIDSLQNSRLFSLGSQATQVNVR